MTGSYFATCCCRVQFLQNPNIYTIHKHLQIFYLGCQLVFFKIKHRYLFKDSLMKFIYPQHKIHYMNMEMTVENRQIWHNIIDFQLAQWSQNSAVHKKVQIFSSAFLWNKNICLLLEISLNFVLNGATDNKSDLFQVMALQIPSHYIIQC